MSDWYRNYGDDNPSGGSGEVSAADLSALDGAFEGATIDDQGFGEVPDGLYEVNVDSVELTRSRNTGHLMLKWKLRILAPQYIDQLLWRNNMIVSDDNVKWLKQDLVRCGLRLRKLSDLPEEMGSLLDLKLEVLKKTKGEYTNVYIRKRLPDNTGKADVGSTTDNEHVPF